MSKTLKKLATVVIISIIHLGCSQNKNSRPADPAGLGPEGTQLREQVKPTGWTANESDGTTQLKAVTVTGLRAINWLNLVNSHRDVNNRLNLADKTTKNPVPPEKPKVSSIKLILEKFSTRLIELPPEMKPFLLEGVELAETPPVTDEVFLKAIRELNSSYQAALRWIGHEPFLFSYAQRSVYDIRGYYFFKKEIDVTAKLKDFDNQDVDTKANYQKWLIGMCHNSETPVADCATELTTALEKKATLAYYSKYLNQAASTYDDFFKAEHIRSDLKWNTDGILLTQDFVLPTIAKVTEWLKFNIEDEWKALNFQLRLNFVKANAVSPYLEFVKGVTPHVSGAQHEKITMDPDYSLDDYSTQWTIRHEFGHILGFPDCYLEFYEEETETMTYYTIETDNLMCAWGGVLQPNHVEQLRKAYK